MQDFAKAGAVAERTVVLQPADDPLQFFPATMFNLFRKCVASGLLSRLDSTRWMMR